MAKLNEISNLLSMAWQKVNTQSVNVGALGRSLGLCQGKIEILLDQNKKTLPDENIKELDLKGKINQIELIMQELESAEADLCKVIDLLDKKKKKLSKKEIAEIDRQTKESNKDPEKFAY